MTNTDLTLHIFSLLKKANVTEVIVCAGARNAPLVLNLSSTEFKVYSFFEERSAAFFALGRIKESGRPVAVLTTSGTAVAELLPATIESYYQNLPLILLTADRPKTYRHTGAPQSIEQLGLFSDYVEKVYDLDVNSTEFVFYWSQSKPLHLNVCFDEPLVDKKTIQNAEVFLKKTEHNISNRIDIGKYKNPLVVLGEIQQDDLNHVVQFLKKIKAPIYAESLSQLKSNSDLTAYVLQSSDVLVRNLFKNNLCESVIRIGGVPTLRFWRDLEFEFKSVPVLHLNAKSFSGLSRQSEMSDLHSVQIEKIFSENHLELIKGQDQKLNQIKTELLLKYPKSEPALTRALSVTVGEQPIYLGNSMPIRNWDQFAFVQSQLVAANRGANGIDGQVSTYLGWSENFAKSFCYIGDLTAMYDLVALGLKSQLKNHQRNIIVCNNYGGRIFNRVFKNDHFINAHQIHFEQWAKMWGWNYLKIQDSAELSKISNLNSIFNVIEIVPDLEQSDLFWNNWDQACQNH